VEYILSAIVGALVLLVAYLFSNRANVHDHGSGAGAIRDSIADSKDRADDIADKIAGASITAGDAGKHIGTASDSLDAAIAIVRSIRRRGAAAYPVAQPGPDRD
jgi:hypothetical protein